MPVAVRNLARSETFVLGRVHPITVARSRRAFTLVELLVVIAIILILLALAAAVVQPMLEGRDVREGARQVATYIGSAQAQAAARNRSVAVWIERLDGKPGTALQLYMAEVPPPYMGDVLGARARISLPWSSVQRIMMLSASAGRAWRTATARQFDEGVNTDEPRAETIDAHLGHQHHAERDVCVICPERLQAGQTHRL